MDTIKTLVEIVFFSISTIAVLISFITYRRSIKIKEAEWLNSFSEKFYENEDYKKIRRILDYRDIKHEAFRKFDGFEKTIFLIERV